MRAIVLHRFGGPEVLSLEDWPVPTPGPGQIRIRNRAAGVNPVDTYIRAGTYARLPPLPCVLGWDGAGVVDAVGPDVARHQAGDRVYFSGTAAGRGLGGYAELVCCDERQVFHLPARLSFGQGAAIGVPYATAHRALFYRGQLRPGETVLVHGASGAVGIATVQLARAHGGTVIGTAGSPAGLELVKAQGAHHAVQHGADGELEEIRRLTGGRGVDLIVEMLANVNLDRDLGLLAMGGRVMVVGNRGRVEIDPRQTMAKESAIMGVMLWAASDDELDEVHQRIAPGLEAGTLTPVVGTTLPAAEVQQAHRQILAGGAVGRIVLTFD